HLRGDEAEDELAFARVLSEDDRLEGQTLLGREGLDQLLDGRVDAAEDRYPDEQPLDAREDAAAQDVGGDGAHDEDEEHGREEAQAGDATAEDALVSRGEERVDEVPEDVQEPRAGDGGHGDEEAGDEADLDPVAKRARHS